jgi:integrase
MYVVDCVIDGKRHRKFFTRGERELADAYAEQQRIRAENLATEDAALLLGNEVLQDAAWGIKQLERHGRNLREAVEHYLVHLDANDRSCSVGELVDAVCRSKEREGKSERYLRDLRGRLGRFEGDFEDRAVASITTNEISDWLADLELSPLSRLNYRRLLVLLFNEGIKRKVCWENPAKDSEKPKIIEGEVGILSVREAAALLEQCDEKLLPALAIGLFAGLRASEIEKLDWSDVDLKQGFTLVRAAKSKSARKRWVDISDNLREWLSLQKLREGKVVPSARELRTLRQEAMIAAGIEEWPHNALRHSYASYHLAKHENMAKLTTQLGHTSPHMVFNHYRNLVMPTEGARYWEITPANVTEFAKKDEEAA